MPWELIDSKVQEMTKSLIREFSEMEPAPADRILSERRLQVYERLVRSMQFRPCVWAKVVCEETDTTYRVNGKHTAVLFSRLFDEFPDQQVVVEFYKCQTLEDVGRLYGTFDSSIVSRSSSDINKAFAATIQELANVPRKILDRCATGISIGLSGCSFHAGTSGIGTPPERAERLLEFPDFVLWVESMISDPTKFGHLCRVGVVAAMFSTYQKCKKDASIFWAAVREENGDKPNDPDRQLARWLLTTSVRSSSEGNIPKSRRADAREMYVRCIHCWNAWRRGEDLKIIKYHATLKPPALV
jgi:hypothetical protein